MKYIIDLIDDIRESISNAEEYELRVGLLREDAKDTSKLVYAGEAPLSSYVLDKEKKRLLFKIDGSDARIAVGALIPSLLIEDMDVMMYPLKIDVNAPYRSVEVVGFGKSDEEKSYILFIKL